MKKIIIITLVGVLLLTGCGKKEDELEVSTSDVVLSNPEDTWAYVDDGTETPQGTQQEQQDVQTFSIEDETIIDVNNVDSTYSTGSDTGSELLNTVKKNVYNIAIQDNQKVYGTYTASGRSVSATYTNTDYTQYILFESGSNKMELAYDTSVVNPKVHTKTNFTSPSSRILTNLTMLPDEIAKCQFRASTAEDAYTSSGTDIKIEGEFYFNSIQYAGSYEVSSDYHVKSFNGSNTNGESVSFTVEPVLSVRKPEDIAKGNEITKAAATKYLKEAINKFWPGKYETFDEEEEEPIPDTEEDKEQTTEKDPLVIGPGASADDTRLGKAMASHPGGQTVKSVSTELDVNGNITKIYAIATTKYSDGEWVKVITVKDISGNVIDTQIEASPNFYGSNNETTEELVSTGDHIYTISAIYYTDENTLYYDIEEKLYGWSMDSGYAYNIEDLGTSVNVTIQSVPEQSLDKFTEQLKGIGEDLAISYDVTSTIAYE